MLVFRYDGNSCFDALIFDGDGCQKSSASPSKVVESNSSSNSHDDLQRTPAKQISCDPPKNYTEAASESLSVCRKRTSHDSELFVDRLLSCLLEFMLIVVTSIWSHSCSSICVTTLTCSEEKKAAKLATKIQRDHPYLPHLTPRVILQIPASQKRWSVKVASIWRTFVCDNDLVKGDICLFELIANQKEVEMIVHIAKQ